MNPNTEKCALVIGNGPSVDILKKEHLERFETFGCNHIYQRFSAWGKQVDNVVITDSNRIREVGGAYRDYKGRLYIGDERYCIPPQRSLARIISREFIPLRQLKKETLDKISIVDHVRWHRLLQSTVFHKGRFSMSMEKGLNFGYSVVTSAIQLAAMAGFKTILLIGVETSYRHDRDYFAGMGHKVSFVNRHFTANPRLYMEPVLALLQVYLEHLDVTVVDCTPEGRLRFISKGALSDEAPFFQVLRRV